MATNAEDAVPTVDPNLPDALMSSGDPFEVMAKKEMQGSQQFAAAQPDYQTSVAREAREQKIVDQSSENIQGFYGKMPKPPEDPTKQLQNIPAIKDESAYAQSATPSLMLVSVLGGFLGRKNAYVALEAQGSVLEALQQGNEKRYQQAKEAHDNAVSKIMDEHKIAMDVYKTTRDALKDNIDSERTAMDAAMTAIGAERKTQTTLMKQYESMYQNIVKQLRDRQEKEATIGLRREALELRNKLGTANTALRWAKTDSDNQAFSSSVSNNLQDLRDAKALWDNIKNKLGLQDSAPLAPDIINKISATFNQDYAKMSQRLMDMTGQNLATQNAGLTSGAQRIQKVEVAELASLPGLQGKTIAQIEESLEHMIKKTEYAQQIADHKTQYWQEFGDQYGLSRRGGSGGGQQPSGGKTYTQEKLQAYADAHNMTVQAAESYLQSQGYVKGN